MTPDRLFRELAAARRRGPEALIAALAEHGVSATHAGTWQFQRTPNLDVRAGEDMGELAARIAAFLVGYVWHDTLGIFDGLRAVPWFRRAVLPPDLGPDTEETDRGADLADADEGPCQSERNSDSDPDPPPRQLVRSLDLAAQAPPLPGCVPSDVIPARAA